MKRITRLVASATLAVLVWVALFLGAFPLSTPAKAVVDAVRGWLQDVPFPVEPLHAVLLQCAAPILFADCVGLLRAILRGLGTFRFW